MADNKNFSAKIDEWVKDVPERIDAVIKDATQSVINEAQTPVAKGGNMRVDTGFLRASGQASLAGMPSGPARGDPDKQYEPEDVSAVIAGFKSPGKIYFGWSAAYARARENKDGFLALAVQNWQKYVTEAAAKIKR